MPLPLFALLTSCFRDPVHDEPAFLSSGLQSPVLEEPALSYDDGLPKECCLPEEPPSVPRFSLEQRIRDMQRELKEEQGGPCALAPRTKSCSPATACSYRSLGISTPDSSNSSNIPSSTSGPELKHHVRSATLPVPRMTQLLPDFQCIRVIPELAIVGPPAAALAQADWPGPKARQWEKPLVYRYRPMVEARAPNGAGHAGAPRVRSTPLEKLAYSGQASRMPPQAPNQ